MHPSVTLMMCIPFLVRGCTHNVNARFCGSAHRGTNCTSVYAIVRGTDGKYNIRIRVRSLSFPRPARVFANMPCSRTACLYLFTDFFFVNIKVYVECPGTAFPACSAAGGSNAKAPPPKSPASISPLTKGKLKNRKVMVPVEALTEDWRAHCDQFDGMGWAARVVSVRSGTATLKFVYGEWANHVEYFKETDVLSWKTL